MSRPRRRFFVPEVVQSSGMDCGPAALKSYLEGHGVSLSYGRLREACQTDVDGTSIEALEELAGGLGVPLEQVMLPKDAVLLDEARALPAIAVFRLPNGNSHFAVVWSSRLGVVQVMDPAVGRRWLSRDALADELFEHVMSVPSADWREWMGSEDGLRLLGRRLAELGVSAETSAALETECLSDESYASFAALDAAIRLVGEGKTKRGAPAESLLRASFEKGRHDRAAIPAPFWTVRPDPEGEPEEVVIRGAVLLRPGTERAEAPRALPEAVAAARDEAPPRPLREIWQRVRSEGLAAPLALAAASFASAVAVVLEALLFRAFLAIPDLVGALVVLLLAVLLLDYASLTGELRLGRRLERRLRLAFQRKIPRLADRYFASRLTSDMAERLHSVHVVRKLPGLARQILREASELLLTAGAILWLAPSTAPVVLAALAAAILVPLLGEPVLFERDSRVRSHVGGLSRFYLDSLLGLVPLRVHGAEPALRSEHETLLSSWARARLRLQRATVTLEALQFAFGYGLVVLLVFTYVRAGGDPGSVLLLAYWALNLPVLGLQIVRLLWRYPEPRNVFLRVSEPLRAPEESDVSAEAPAIPKGSAMSLRLEGVSVRVSGRRLLEELDFEIEPGSHVAVVGPSGAGKTSLFGLLLGFHSAESGRVLLDGREPRGARLAEVRAETAWVDPSIQIWNRSVEDNLLYGNEDGDPGDVASALERAELLQVLDSLPEGRSTRLGEGGALVSGGEGQRVRLARAFLRKRVRLALLDEPFRGLDREHRAELLRRARAHWRGATLLAITHDVSETLSFDRVLVLERGRLVEDGAPRELSRRGGSRYRTLLDVERQLTRLWGEAGWRKWRIEKGELRDVR